MDAKDIVRIITAVLSGLLLGYGILVRSGVTKSWWATPSDEAAGFAYMFPLMSIGCLFALVFERLLETPHGALEIVILVLIVAGGPLIFLLTRMTLNRLPSWLRPAWLNYLYEQYPGTAEYEGMEVKVIDALRWEARQVGHKRWSRKARSQETLKQWADECIERLPERMKEWKVDYDAYTSELSNWLEARSDSKNRRESWSPHNQ
jgi:hypothetical protein